MAVPYRHGVKSDPQLVRGVLAVGCVLQAPWGCFRGFMGPQIRIRAQRLERCISYGNPEVYGVLTRMHKHGYLSPYRLRLAHAPLLVILFLIFSLARPS